METVSSIPNVSVDSKVMDKFCTVYSLATDSSDKGGNVIITWYYSPCESYNVPGDKKGDCNGVGVCMAQGEKFYNYGKASSATCVTTLNGSYPVLQYSGDNGV